MDDCIRYAIVSGKKAIKDAGLDDDALAKLDKTRCGVLAGSGMGGLTVFQARDLGGGLALETEEIVRFASFDPHASLSIVRTASRRSSRRATRR